MRGVEEDESVLIEGKIVSYLTSSHQSIPDSFLLRGPDGLMFQVSISTIASRGTAAQIVSNGLKYGDRVRIQGLLAPVGVDMRWINRAHIRITPKGIEKIGDESELSHVDRVVRALYGIRAHIVERLIALFGPQRGGLLAGLIVEGGALLDSDTKKLFQKTGLSHIVALSGYNTSIIIDFSTMVLGAALPRRWRIVSTGGLAVLFCVMTGASPPLLRASIMALLRLLSDITYRKFDAFRALIFSACCIVAYNPFLIFYSLSFQLSFLATLGLIVYARSLQKLCAKIFLPNFIAQTLATTLAAQVYTLPLLVYRFHGLSIISLLANVIVLPVIPLFMLGAAVSVGLSHLPVNLITAVVLHIWEKVLGGAIEVLLYVIKIMADIKYAYVYASLHPAWMIVLWAVGIGIGAWLMRRPKSEPLQPSS